MKKLLLVICVAFCHISLIPLNAQFRINLGKNSPMSKLQYAEMAINNLYVDSVNEEKLVEDAIRGMLKELDPHSSYSTPQEVKELNEPLQGNFDGIGVQFNMIDDTLLVIQPTTKGPSEKVGILAGDRIITVNDTSIAGVKMPRNEIMKRLRGPRGTKVKLGIKRRSVAETLFFTVTRDKIPMKSIDAVYMIRPGVGYIRIEKFGATTYTEFMEGLATLQEQGMESLILDLQENGGGYLEAAVRIANEFLEDNDLIVYTEGNTLSHFASAETSGARAFIRITDGSAVKISFGEEVIEPVVKFDVTDKEAISKLSPYLGKTANVKIVNRGQLSSDRVNTLCLPFDMTEAQVTEMFGDAKPETFTQMTSEEKSLLTATDTAMPTA